MAWSGRNTVEMCSFYHEVASKGFSRVFTKILSILVHISGPIEPITLIWVPLERSFPPTELEYK